MLQVTWLAIENSGQSETELELDFRFGDGFERTSTENFKVDFSVQK